jgi:hypothetical protein
MLRRTFLGGLLGIPATLESHRGSHPRLYFDSARRDQLRAAAAGTHAAVWKLIRQQADSFAAQRPPVYQETSDEEQLWQREVGNKLPFLALAHAITGESKYLTAARDWSLASCGYPHWGGKRFDGTDLAAGHQLFGLALVYDWLYADLDAAAKATILDTLLTRGATMFRACSTQYWRNEYLQNHLWVNITGLAAAALAVFDEPGAGERAEAWLGLILDKYRRTEAALGPDGASHEGVGYWSYGVEYMLKFWRLAAELLGEDLSSPWWANTAAYRLYLGLPRNAWTPRNTIVDLADCPRYDWYGPEYLLRALASRYRDGHAQWLAAEIESAGVAGYAARWLNLLWYDPKVAPLPPSDLPTLRHFEDLGIVSARSDWSGSESLLVFKCGPPIGRQATRQFDFDPGGGHVHPDNNHFVLFGAGEWLVRDDGYTWKQTDHHNTLLVDGKGQLGEGYQWFRAQEPIRRRADPRILRAASSPEVDEIHGDAAAAYPRESGLGRFLRRVYFLKPDVLIVVDQIELDSARALDLRFHPEFPGTRLDDGAILCRGKRAALRIDTLTADGVEIAARDLAGKDRDGKPSARFTVQLTKTAASWRNAVAFSWCPAEKDPTRVVLERDGDVWIFRAGERALTVVP